MGDLFVVFIFLFSVIFGIITFFKKDTRIDDFSYKILNAHIQKYFEKVKSDFNLYGDIIIENQVLKLEGVHKNYHISIQFKSKDIYSPIIFTVLFPSELTKKKSVFKFSNKNLNLNFLYKPFDVIKDTSVTGFETMLYGNLHIPDGFEHLKFYLYPYKLMIQVDLDDIHSDTLISEIIKNAVSMTKVSAEILYDENYIIDLIKSKTNNDYSNESILCFGKHALCENKMKILKKIRRKKELTYKLSANRFIYEDRIKYISEIYKNIMEYDDSKKDLIFNEISTIKAVELSKIMKLDFQKTRNFTLKKLILNTLSNLEENSLPNFLNQEVFLKRNYNDSIQQLMIELMAKHSTWETISVLKKIYFNFDSSILRETAKSSLTELGKKYPSEKGLLSIPEDDILDGALSKAESEGKLST